MRECNGTLNFFSKTNKHRNFVLQFSLGFMFWMVISREFLENIVLKLFYMFGDVHILRIIFIQLEILLIWPTGNPNLCGLPLD